MKNLRTFSIIVATILVAASAAVYAGEIDTGSIDVVINDDVYGSVSPKLNLENTTITLKAYEIVKGGESTYEVQDNITIPLNIVINKEKVYTNKMITGRIKLYGSFTDVRAKKWFNAYVADGELFGKDVNISENVSIAVKYPISEDTFYEGEELVMCTLIAGRYLPGKVEDSSLLWSLDNVLSDSALFGLGKIIKEFVDIDSVIGLKLQIVTIKHIKLNVSYEYGGQQVQPDEYILNATVAEGDGRIIKDPNLGSYPAGTNVTLTAVASSGYYFDHWDGNITGTDNPVNITMDSNKSVQAYFLKSPISIAAKSFGIRVASFIVKNQNETNISFAWNITLKGGLLGGVNVFSNGTVENLSSDDSAVINSGRTKLFALGPGRATVNIDRPGEELITKEFGVTFIGPIVLVS